MMLLALEGRGASACLIFVAARLLEQDLAARPSMISASPWCRDRRHVRVEQGAGVEAERARLAIPKVV